MSYVKVKDNILYTPLVQHRKGELTVTSIGAMHIGELKYYERLQNELDSISFGFFERIKPLTSEENVPLEKRQYIQGVQKLKEVYQRFADYLGIVTQHRLKYPNSWQNPDITLDEFITVAPDKVLKKITGLEDKMDIFKEPHKLHPEELAALFKGVIKYMLNVPLLHEDLFLINGPMYKKVILEERNQRLFDAMGPKLEQPETDELGIIYGAAHLKGIDEFLRHNNFKREGELWVPALDLESKISTWHALKTVIKDLVSREMEKMKIKFKSVKGE